MESLLSFLFLCGSCCKIACFNNAVDDEDMFTDDVNIGADAEGAKCPKLLAVPTTGLLSSEGGLPAVSGNCGSCITPEDEFICCVCS